MVSKLLIFFLAIIPFRESGTTNKEICLTTNELTLYEIINSAREKKGLPEVGLSQSLTLVAKLHAMDLMENEPFNDVCNPHSWSDEGAWAPCCYRADHSAANCMWKKPNELTDYQGDGYEIVAYWMSGEDPVQEISPETALRMWLESDGHANVILNKMSFRRVEWNAVGVAIYGNYASVWFGAEKDDAPPPQICSNGQ